MKILVAGGAGYIGSHTMVSLLDEGYDIVCVDNLSNSSNVAISRVNQITKKEVKFYKANCESYDEMSNIFKKEKFDTVIMFAGFKAVGESVINPIMYYDNNINIILNTLKLMREYNCFNIVFSSSATVYGNPKEIPVTEDSDNGNIDLITNPYGRTKKIIEDILIDVAKSDNRFKVVILRYFNPVGCHDSGLIGEDPKGIPNNLMPYIAQVAVGVREKVNVFGNDYNTIDGTGVRDYIHVMDLARGHVLALKKFNCNENVSIYNLGTGKGYSVLEVIKAYSKACKKDIPYVICERRKGDVDTLFCNPLKAKEELGFIAKYGIDEMCESSYNFQVKNPNGYNN